MLPNHEYLRLKSWQKVMSAYEMAQWFHFSPEVTNSLMARSISTPFAMILAEDIHGSAALVSLIG
jgi:putative effector of murein hydrolase